jgi:hypothetical protein
MVMSGQATETDSLRMGEINIGRVYKYDYLGVTLGAKLDYLEDHEKKLLSKLGRYSGLIKKKSLFSYNRYEVVRILWKAVAVPALTYGNEVLVCSQNLRTSLELYQKQIGRFALRVNQYTANAAVQGELGWSTFEKREASSKIKFVRRLSEMPNNNFTKIVFEYVQRMSNRAGNTRWCRRTRHLEGKYAENLPRFQPFGVSDSGWLATIAKAVNSRAQNIWRQEVESKSSLHLA